jgi:hypothetical protein
MKLLATLLILISANLAFAIETTSFTCSNSGNVKETNSMYVHMTLSATLSEAFDGQYELTDGSVSMIINDGPSAYAENAWLNTSETFNHKLNKKNYRPRTYKNHLKFETFADLSAWSDLLLPLESLNDETFNAVVILTSVKDHYGASITLKCTSK